MHQRPGRGGVTVIETLTGPGMMNGVSWREQHICHRLLLLMTRDNHTRGPHNKLGINSQL